MTNGSQVTHALSVCCLLHLCRYSERGTEPLVLKLVLGVPVAEHVKSCEWTQMNSPLPMAELWTGTLEPGSFPVPPEKEHHHANGMRVLTFPSLHHLWPFWYTPPQWGHLSQPSCAAQCSFRQDFMGTFGWIFPGNVNATTWENSLCTSHCNLIRENLEMAWGAGGIGVLFF